LRVFFDPAYVAALIAGLPVYWLLAGAGPLRLLLLAVLSCGLLFTIHPVFVVVVAGLALSLHRSLALWEARTLSTRNVLMAAIGAAAAVIGIGKYGGTLVTALYGQNDWVARNLIMPLGTSYFAFRLVHYALDRCRGTITDRSFGRLLAYLVFLPTFPAGPLETYQGFYGKRSDRFDGALFNDGVRRIVFGYFVKVVVVDLLMQARFGSFLGRVRDPGFDLSAATPLAPWAFVVLSFLQAYLDLSAYTHLAIGFSALYGFRVMENFSYPFFKRNLGEFWRSWHISLSSWCRDNVYLPVLGTTRRPWVALYASMLTMGLWHHLNWNWLAWSLYHGTGLVAVAQWQQRKRKDKRLRALAARWKPLGAGSYAVTFLFVALGYSFVATPNATQAGRLLWGCLRGPALWATLQLARLAGDDGPPPDDTKRGMGDPDRGPREAVRLARPREQPGVRPVGRQLQVVRDVAGDPVARDDAQAQLRGQAGGRQ
jgi:alginate O-acetyltransferase complex protein AlgI